MTRRRLLPVPRTVELRPPLTAAQQQRLNGWLLLLDDPALIDTAQSVLRLPPHRWPVPPVALPAVRDDEGRVLVEAVDAPAPDEEPTPVPAAAVALRGAYARRAAARKAGNG